MTIKNGHIKATTNKHLGGKKNLSLSKQKAFPYCLLDKVVCKAVNTWIDSTHGAAAASFKRGWVLAADF